MSHGSDPSSYLPPAAAVPVLDPCPNAEPHTPAEEAAHWITHGLGAVFSLVGLACLVGWAARTGDGLRLATVIVYGASLAILYLASTLFHALPVCRAKHWLRVCDHVAIYGLIAGTYTPFLLVMVRGGLGWTLFGILWGLAVIGTVFKVFFVHRFDLASTLLYLAMGWIGLAAAGPMFNALPGGALAWIFAGGAAYTVGVIFYLWQRLPFNHAVWHLFVLAGSACHFVAIAAYVI